MEPNIILWMWLEFIFSPLGDKNSFWKEVSLCHRFTLYSPCSSTPKTLWGYMLHLSTLVVLNHTTHVNSSERYKAHPAAVKRAPLSWMTRGYPKEVVTWNETVFISGANSSNWRTQPCRFHWTWTDTCWWLMSKYVTVNSSKRFSVFNWVSKLIAGFL